MLEFQDFQGRLGFNFKPQYNLPNTVPELDECFFYLVYPTSEFVFLQGRSENNFCENASCLKMMMMMMMMMIIM